VSKKTEKQFQKALESTRVLEEDVSYYVNREWDQRFYGSDDDDVYVESDDHYECGCCKCCGCDCYPTKKLWLWQVLRMRMRMLLNKKAR